jgi:small subunit ribosomal protein S18
MNAEVTFLSPGFTTLKPDPAKDSPAGPEQREQRGKTMAEETQARTPAAADATSTHQAASGPGAGPRSAGRPAGGQGNRGKFFRRKKVCKFCTEKIDAIPYRDVRLLQGFVAERGKIVPRRLTGVCTKHQRRLTRAIKQARNIALLPFATRH